MNIRSNRSNNEQLIIVNWREQVSGGLILWLSATFGVAYSHTEIGQKGMEGDGWQYHT
jgi:hypothetical protein